MSSDAQNIRFYQLLEIRLLSEFRKKFLHYPINTELMFKTHVLFDEIITSIFAQSKYVISPKATSWLSDQFLKTLKFDDVQLNINYPSSGVKLSELNFDEIQLFRNLFDVTIMGPELTAELNRRSLS